MFFTPNFQNILDCALNKKPERIPLYEHNISYTFMERITGSKFSKGCLFNKKSNFFKHYCNFFKDYGYDTVTYEACVSGIMPNGGALCGSKPGFIDSYEKLLTYDFDVPVERFKKTFSSDFKYLRKHMPKGMKAIGGVGNGIFELAQDLVGFENLCIAKYEDPELYENLFIKLGDMLYKIWDWFLNTYKDIYCVVRFGDDLGYKMATMLPPQDIREHIIPQYKRIIDLIHSHGMPFLLHSCGNIFEIMPDLIDAGIDAKHSNEDQIALMDKWVKEYGDKIGNFGGIDTDHIVRMDNNLLEKEVKRIYKLAESKNGGFAIGSGNSIPDYINDEKYLIMVNTIRKLRGDFN